LIYRGCGGFFSLRKVKEIILYAAVVDFGRGFSRKLQEVAVEIQITLYRLIAVFPRDKLTSKVFKLEFRRYRRFILAGKSPLPPFSKVGNPDDDFAKEGSFPDDETEVTALSAGSKCTSTPSNTFGIFSTVSSK
jgi:hypothetical protein